MINPIKGMKPQMFPVGDVTQVFGVNKALYAFMGLEGHNGADYTRPHGEAMFAVENGVVLEVKFERGGFGKHVRFLSDAKDENGHQREWTYGHCHVIMVKVGDKVTAGQLLATMGNTGFVVSGATPFWKFNPFAGTHLHLGLRLIKVVKRGGWSYPKSDIKLTVINSNNGFKGAIDPAPYLVGATDLPSATVLQELQLTLVSLLRTVLSSLQTNK
jgi:murein DD-endopeptidase MepM/ murein hydrolase activator NlpD